MRRICLAVLVAVVFTVVAVPAAPPPVVTGELGAKLDRYLVDSGFEGVALVAREGSIVLMKGYGLADREKGEPWAVDSVISVGSITKQFTAAAILKLEMEGTLRVEDPLTKFFEGVPADKQRITIHQLLTHTAGLESDFAGDYEPVGRDAYVKRILASPLRSAPGTEHFYANSGYSLLAAIVEVVAGLPYEAYLRERLLLPAGVKETGYRIPQWDARRVPVGYRAGKRWGTMLEKPWAADGPYWALRGNGGIESTLGDLHAWSRALDGDVVLSASARKKLFTPHVQEGPDAESHYAYGWTVFKTPWNTKLVAHNGGNGVFSADFRRYVDDGIVVITAAADSEVKAWKFSGALGRIAHGEEVTAERHGAAGPLGQLGDGPRHALIRQFVDAFNSRDLERVRAFRATHMVQRSDGPTDAQRDQTTRRMWGEFGTLEIDGVLAEDDEAITVRMKSGTGPPPRFRFVFSPENRIAGLAVEIGD